VLLTSQHRISFVLLRIRKIIRERSVVKHCSLILFYRWDFSGTCIFCFLCLPDSGKLIIFTGSRESRVEKKEKEKRV